MRSDTRPIRRNRIAAIVGRLRVRKQRRDHVSNARLAGRVLARPTAEGRTPSRSAARRFAHQPGFDAAWTVDAFDRRRQRRQGEARRQAQHVPGARPGAAERRSRQNRSRAFLLRPWQRLHEIAGGGTPLVEPAEYLRKHVEGLRFLALRRRIGRHEIAAKNRAAGHRPMAFARERLVRCVRR